MLILAGFLAGWIRLAYINERVMSLTRINERWLGLAREYKNGTSPHTPRFPAATCTEP